MHVSSWHSASAAGIDVKRSISTRIKALMSTVSNSYSHSKIETIEFVEKVRCGD
jgi:hypothetical protein